MPLYEPTVPVRYTAPLRDFLRAQYPDAVDEIWRSAVDDDGAPLATEATMSIGQLDTLFDKAALRTGRRDLGFEIGKRITLDLHGPLSAALQHTMTLDQLLRLVMRYMRLITPSVFMEYRRNFQQGEVIYRPAAGMSTALLHTLHEIHAVSFHCQVMAGLSTRLGGYDVYLSMEAPAHAARYRELRPARFHFGALPLPEVRIIIGAEMLDAELPGEAGNGAKASAAALSAMQRGIGRTRKWSDWVELMLREAEGCQPTLADLAAMLNVCVRTLTLYLAREGHTFRELAKQIRHERACRLLEGGQQSISQIAYRLGYGDQANFSHAFRAVGGQTPRAYRAAAGNGARSSPRA